ncbi:hypothetical protein AVEN_179133-1 [Araneus ventricosus]|uniref:Uncharacterized protein n=1 Tax=Araneus ventricosus TaxID=182803 RepID=A0A4Y2J1I3_ARAVE|nr:hypothetical protein AVEN_258803-1 [Araneus ventricosus]GBM84064.1 hypothetical protein AVEN_8720-1 [Araneus ventricosus]GBM84101.1 hypothetical protein AVEN_179133-1 [Araneus ventricosus]
MSCTTALHRTNRVVALHTIPFLTHPFRQIIQGQLRANSGHSDPPLLLLFPRLQTANTLIASRAREPSLPSLHASVPVAFQHLWPSSPNGYPERFEIEIFDLTVPILIGFWH